MIDVMQLEAIRGRTVSGFGFVDLRTGQPIPPEEDHPGVLLSFGAVVVLFSDGKKVLLAGVVENVEELSIDLDWRGDVSVAENLNIGPIDRVAVATGQVSALSTQKSLWSLCLSSTQSDSILCICLADLEADANPTYMPDSICVIKVASLARGYQANASSGSAYGSDLSAIPPT